MRPPAPPRLSAIICWPSAGESFSAMRRATVSVPPPGAFGTMMRMGLVGYCCACAIEQVTQIPTTTDKTVIRTSRSVLLTLLHTVGVEDRFRRRAREKRQQGAGARGIRRLGRKGDAILRE